MRSQCCLAVRLPPCAPLITFEIISRFHEIQQKCQVTAGDLDAINLTVPKYQMLKLLR
jgi:hypothetical protein